MNLPQDFDAQELEQLDLLAEELRLAVPSAKLSADFDQRLQMRLDAQPWTFRSAMQSNRLLRVAAALLMITTVAGPVSALVFLFIQPKATPVSLEWLPTLPTQETTKVSEPTIDPAIPPLDSTLEEAFGLPWHQAVQRTNRMALVISQWQQVYAGQDYSTPAQAPLLMDWSEATPLELKGEFERRCLLGLSSPPPASLAERIRSLDSSEEAASWLKAWNWVLEGPGIKPGVFFSR